MEQVSPSARIVIVGGGKMGEAVMGGWIAAQSGPAANLGGANFCVADPGEERRAYLAQQYGVACVAQVAEITEADMVVLAVKPQVMMGVLAGLSDLVSASDALARPLFVSVAAGLSTARLEEALPEAARLVRVMPNTPLLVGEGATAVTGGAQATKADVALVCELFAGLGSAYIVDESEMDAIGALSGSGPAYVAAFIEALREAGVAQGLDAEFSEALALQTLYGTVVLMKETGQDAGVVRQNVCSPGGSTLAGLQAMTETGFADSLKAGVAAAVHRSKELGQC